MATKLPKLKWEIQFTLNKEKHEATSTQVIK